jgi:hypothetical protein
MAWHSSLPNPGVVIAALALRNFLLLRLNLSGRRSIDQICWVQRIIGAERIL